jgi:acyl-CoA thioesterase
MSDARLSPDELARACAEAMWKEDDASKGLGMKILEVRAGQATLSMTIGPRMVNGQRIAQGNITFIRPAKLGDLLVAQAREISRSGRSGIYDVRITAGETVIAEFRGHSRSISGTWLPEPTTGSP